MSKFVIASSKDWFNKSFNPSRFRDFDFKFISKKSELNVESLRKINPKYIFFTHWNWIVSEEIFNTYDCIVFHTAPLPYGRGGSPIQNLMIRGFKKAPVCSLKMTKEIDGGPIYLKNNVNLSGNIEEIFNRIALVIEKQILKICTQEIKPKKQVGKVKIFKRLTRSENRLSEKYSLEEIYDRIRMVDGVDYPNAFIDFGNFEILFKDAHLSSNKLTAKVTFKNKT